MNVFKSILVSIFIIACVRQSPCYGQNIDFNFNQSEKLPLNAKGMLLENLNVYIYLQESNSPAIALSETYFISRIYISKKVNFLIGPKLDTYRHTEVEYGILTSTGIEYNPTENSYINLLYNYRVNDLSKDIFHYNTFNKNCLNLGTGLKF